MKIISWNVNGLRAVYKKNFLGWFEKTKADIICLQETKAQKEQLSDDLINIKGYHSFFNSAQKKGYSGVAVFTKKRPLSVKGKLGHKRFDSEGRILELEFSGFTLVNLYIPHGGRQKENLDYKLEVYEDILKYIKEKTIVLGDFNVAHEEIDLARPKDNKNNIMFTIEEREQISRILKLGFKDTFRELHPKEKKYTWWPYFANARERNLGWRIDYVFSSKPFKDAFILTNVSGSDHCPVGISL